MPDLDQWAQWLLHRRHGGDPQRLQATLQFLYPIRDRVLDNASLTPTDTLLDVGCGDGLIAFGALDRLPQGRVIFSDISVDLLEHARGLAGQMGVLDRAEFVAASAEGLTPFAAESVDVVTTRSVLIYVGDKQAAFNTFYRVLRPGGRLSLFEPINRFRWPEPDDRFWGYDAAPVAALAGRVRAVYRALQPVSDPMLNFDERDLLDAAEQAGFRTIHLELRADIRRGGRLGPDQIVSWEAFVHFAPNPRVPTLVEALAQALTPDERERFVAHLRPLVEAGQSSTASAVAYLWAAK